MEVDFLRRLLAGLAAGDSLGSTSEFVSQKEVPNVYLKVKDQGWPFRQAGGGFFGWRPGDPTDDTEMALCMIRSFFTEGGFSPQSIAEEFVSWMRGGPIDIGGTTINTLKTCEKSSCYWQGGLQFWRERPNYAANGSLMRNGIIVGMANSLEEAFSFTLKHGMITHYAPLPQTCCLAQTYLIWDLLHDRGLREDWTESFEAVLEEYFQTEADLEVRMWFNNVNKKSEYEKSLATFRDAN